MKVRFIIATLALLPTAVMGADYYTVSRTSHSQSDLQGIWTNGKMKKNEEE